MTALIFVLSVLSLLISGPPAPMHTAKSAPELPQTAVARAGWLAGCWHMAGERGNPSVRLNWARASNDLLVGTWIHVPIGLEPEYSFLRIESAPALTLVWQAPGQRPLRMPIDPSALSSDAIAFVNSGTGIPKRVEFRRGKDAALLAQTYDEGPKAPAMSMKKVSCS